MGKREGSGRKKVEVSCLFKHVEDNGKMPKVQCTFCSKQLSKSGSRMKQHISACLKCPMVVKSKYNLQVPSPRQKDKRQLLPTTPTSGTSFASPPSEKLDRGFDFTQTPKSSRMQFFIDKINTPDQVNTNIEIWEFK